MHLSKETGQYQKRNVVVNIQVMSSDARERKSESHLLFSVISCHYFTLAFFGIV